jgi:hypothetical protein
VFEHKPVYNAKIEFKNIKDKINAKIKALCDINYDDKYSDNLPLEIETKFDFYGILCGRSTENKYKNKAVLANRGIRICKE